MCPALPSYRGHVLMDNRHALIVDCKVTQAVGTGTIRRHRFGGIPLPGAHQKTIGADKNYDTRGFVAEMRRIGVTPHVAQNTARSGGSAIDGGAPRGTRATPSRSTPVAASRRCLAGSNSGAVCASSSCACTGKVSAVFGLHVIAYNLIRLANLHKPAMAAA